MIKILRIGIQSINSRFETVEFKNVSEVGFLAFAVHLDPLGLLQVGDLAILYAFGCTRRLRRIFQESINLFNIDD